MAEVTPADVKRLRDQTGAGVMDSKRALVESGGDLERAKDWLRTKGMARAGQRSGRATREGIVAHYGHSAGGAPVKVAAMVEVNCESDFVAKTDDFRTLGRELAIQVAGAHPRFVRREDVPAEEVERETRIAREKAIAEGRPARVLDQIVRGSLEKFYQQVCLLEQPYVRDHRGKKPVHELITEAVAKLGENISVARFVRMEVGEAAADGDRQEH